MPQSASIRLSFWLLVMTPWDLHLLDCSIGMDAYWLMYYRFDLMSCTCGEMATFIGPNVYYTIRLGVGPYSIPIESHPYALKKKKKKKWNGQPWPTCHLGLLSVVSWKFIEWDGWSKQCQVPQNYLVVVLLFESTFCDWRMTNWCMLLQDLKTHLDNGKKLPSPDGILINGRGSGAAFNVEQGKVSSNLNLVFANCHYFFALLPSFMHSTCIIHVLYRKNLQAQNIKCWIAKLTQFPHSKP